MNELMIVENINKRLQEPRKEIVFPLQALHRRELRNLRNVNIGNLRERLTAIEMLKRDEYIDKHKKEIEIELQKKNKICESLNKNWKEIVCKISNLIKERQKLEDNSNLVFLDCERGYNDINSLPKIKSCGLKREYSIDEKRVSRKIAEEEFKKKYGKSFDGVRDNISDIETKYEEAINFGDLEIVKELYYIMKKADSLFEKIDKLQV